MLETAAGLGLTGFFPLHHAGIAGQKPFFSEQGPLARINGNKGTGNAQANGTGLACHSSPRHRNMEVICSNALGGLKRKRRLSLGSYVPAEKFTEGFVVDHKLAVSRDDPDTGHASFAAACGPNWKINLAWQDWLHGDVRFPGKL